MTQSRLAVFALRTRSIIEIQLSPEKNTRPIKSSGIVTWKCGWAGDWRAWVAPSAQLSLFSATTSLFEQHLDLLVLHFVPHFYSSHHHSHHPISPLNLLPLLGPR